MKQATILRNCKNQTNRNACAAAVGILHFFFENSGLHVVFRDGRTITEHTPLTMTGNEHLFSIIAQNA